MGVDGLRSMGPGQKAGDKVWYKAFCWGGGGPDSSANPALNALLTFTGPGMRRLDSKEDHIQCVRHLQERDHSHIGPNSIPTVLSDSAPPRPPWPQNKKTGYSELVPESESELELEELHSSSALKPLVYKALLMPPRIPMPLPEQAQILAQ